MRLKSQLLPSLDILRM